MKPAQQPVIGSFVEKICKAIPTFHGVNQNAKIIDIRAAAEQFFVSFENLKSEAFDYSIFAGGVMPPFPRCIFEYEGGQHGFTIIEDGDNPKQHDLASLFVTVPIDDESKVGLREQYPNTCGDLAWQVFITGHTSIGKNIGTSNSFSIYLRRDGGPLVGSNGLMIVGYGEDVDIDDAKGELVSHILPVLFAITLMQCKNVSMEPVSTPLPLAMKKSKRRKQIDERKRHPAFERHIVVIRDKKGRVISTTLQRQQSGSKRLHWVRGHFSNYTEAAPLFGRIVGRFWIPAHLSGLASDGVIESDYRLEA
jgi:hypothetical protein